MSTKVNFTERLKRSDIPLNQCIVIGSGALDLRGIREARDIDLVVTPEAYQTLHDNGWTLGKKGSSSFALEKGDFEVWTDWSTDGSGQPDFISLIPHTEQINGITTVTLEYLVERKKERGSQKDLEDIAQIETYFDQKDVK